MIVPIVQLEYSFGIFLLFWYAYFAEFIGIFWYAYFAVLVYTDLVAPFWMTTSDNHPTILARRAHRLLGPAVQHRPK